MLEDAAKALTQMLSPPLRAVLWKSIGLALALIVVASVALDRLIEWLVGAGSTSVESTLGTQAHLPVTAIAWLLSIAAGLGVCLLAVLSLAPPTGAAATPVCSGGRLKAVYVRTTGAMGTVAGEYGFENTSASRCRLTGYPTAQLLTASGAKLASSSSHAAAGAFGITVKPVVLGRGAIAYFAVVYHSQTGFGRLTCPASAALELTAPGTSTGLVLKGPAGQIAAYSGSQVHLRCGLLRVSPVTAKPFQ